MLCIKARDWHILLDYALTTLLTQRLNHMGFSFGSLSCGMQTTTLFSPVFQLWIRCMDLRNGRKLVIVVCAWLMAQTWEGNLDLGRHLPSSGENLNQKKIHLSPINKLLESLGMLCTHSPVPQGWSPILSSINRGGDCDGWSCSWS